MAYITIERHLKGRIDYSYVKKADVVAILVETEIAKEHNLLLTQQFRIGPFINQGLVQFLELPAGNIDPGESPEEAAERELFEETGIIPLTPMVNLGFVYSSPGCFTERTLLYYYYLVDSSEAKLKVDNVEGHEHLVNRWVPRKTLKAEHFHDAKLLSAMTLAYDIHR
jgi:8-oxo-dGTP pyrophosphatase MutT (NUDIX family)